MKRTALRWAAALTMAAWVPSGEAASAQEAGMSVNIVKATPVLLTDRVQACIDFWAGFGLEASVVVPGEDGPAFAILTNGAIELMYQTFASARADNAAAVEGVNRAVMYLEVESLDTILPAAQRAGIVVPERTTDYGAREVYVRDPAGNLIGFAQQAT